MTGEASPPVVRTSLPGSSGKPKSVGNCLAGDSNPAADAVPGGPAEDKKWLSHLHFSRRLWS